MKFNGIIKYFDSARFIQLEYILIWLQSLFQENYDAKHIYQGRIYYVPVYTPFEIWNLSQNLYISTFLEKEREVALYIIA